MADTYEHHFETLDSGHADHEDGISPFTTLWTEFARNHPGLSPPRTPTRVQQLRPMTTDCVTMQPKSVVELRALEYVSEYDSNLMCPICHVPFIDPVVLDCDHTFCGECFEEYRHGGSSTDRSRCPSCRFSHPSASKKASRLIKNMCNDIQVRCPNEGCERIMARGCVEQHVTKECAEQYLQCPDAACKKQTKRKNMVPGQCIHSTEIECDCGATIRLGCGEWLKHKDTDCPNTNGRSKQEVEGLGEEVKVCPGSEYGCHEAFEVTEYDVHVKLCTFARMAPHFRKHTKLLQTLQDQLAMVKLRNEVLETGFDRLSDLINKTIHPQLETLLSSRGDNDIASVSDVEEIPRDLSVLPAHLRELTPSPNNLDLDYNHSQHHGHHPSHAQLQVETRLSNVEAHVNGVQSQVNELDARSSMALMNETLRIREELAHINGQMYSTRAQVQWLLNRERIVGQREAMRGRAAVGNASTTAANNASSSEVAGTTTGVGSAGSAQPTATTAGTNIGGTAGTRRPSIDRNMSSAWSASQAGANVPGSGLSSAATSPIFGAARPSLRRQSGGSSQERVKL